MAKHQVAGAVGPYRPDIDGLRAIAITAVVAFHTGLANVTGGFVGVDIFFVLSGFLITTMLFKEAEQTGRIDLTEFYARRVRRLMPAATLVLVVSIVLAYFFLMPIGDEQLRFARSAAAAALFASNIYFWKSSGGYFDGPSDQIPLLHTWSLSVEEQFYVLWPLLLIAIVRVARVRGFKLFNLVLGALAVLFVTSLAISIWWASKSASAGFYLLPARVWELAAGAFLGVVLYKKIPILNSKNSQHSQFSQFSQHSKNSKSNWFATTLAIAGILAISCSIIFFDAGLAFPGWVALLPVSGTVAVLLAGAISDKNWVTLALSTPPMVLVGKLSYSWYLWHWPLLAFLQIENLGQKSLTQNLIAAFLALMLAYLTYKYVENPIRLARSGWFSTKRGTLKMGVILIILSILVLGLLLGMRDLVKVTKISKQVDLAYKDRSPLRLACTRDGTKPLESIRKTECEIGNKSTSETLVVWGDSHSDHWMPLIVDYFKNHQIVQYSMPSCPPLLGNTHPSVINCRPFNDMVADSLSQNPDIKGVILAARWPAYIGSPAMQHVKRNDRPIYFDASVTSTEEALNVFEISLDRTLTSIEKRGLKTLVMAPTPEFNYPVPVCIFRKSPDFCQTSRAENDAYREKVLLVLTKVVAKHPNTKLANSYEAMCNEQQCPVINDQQQILYGDGDHLTGAGAKHALTAIQNEFVWFAQK